jgi:hypothetical protein
VSYWVNNILSVVSIYALVIGLTIFLEQHKELGSFGILTLIVLLLVLVLAISVWQLVGIWRSSSHHVARGGRAFWAGLAKVIVIIAAIRLAFDLSGSYLPIISEHFQIVLGDSRFGTHRFRLLRNGTELEFSGGINVGTAKDFDRMLDAASQVRVLHLNSIGGRIAEADKIAQTVRNRQLVTYVSENCQSACTHIFLAGSERWLGGRAKLGFHRPDVPGLRSQDLLQIMEAERQYLLSLGLPASFVTKVLSTPSESMWLPTPGELLSARVISGVADDAGFAASGQLSSLADADRLSKLLLQIPVYMSLKRVYPTLFAIMVQEVSKGFRKGDTEDVAYSSARRLFGILMKNLLPHTLDDLIFELSDVYLLYMKELSAYDTASCVALADDSKGARLGVSLAAQFPALSKRELAANEAIISRTDPRRSIPTEAEVEKQLSYVISKLSAKAGNNLDILNKANLAESDYPEYCKVAIEFRQEVMRLPKKQAADLLRYLHSL